MRRAIRASLSPFATLRSTRGVRSRRIVNADILPSIESMAAANHEPRADGIPQRQHESGVSTIGIKYSWPPLDQARLARKLEARLQIVSELLTQFCCGLARQQVGLPVSGSNGVRLVASQVWWESQEA